MSKSLSPLAESILDQSEGGSQHGCFITPLTDYEPLQPVLDELRGLAAELKNKIDSYVRQMAEESCNEIGTEVTDEEVAFGNKQVLKWILGN